MLTYDTNILPAFPNVNHFQAIFLCEFSEDARFFLGGCYLLPLGAFPQEREELPTIGAAEQLGAEAPFKGSRLPRGPVKQTLSG